MTGKFQIWKYQLKIEDSQTITVPRGAKVLSVAVQGNDLCLWAKVRPDRWSDGDTTDLEVRVVGTGHPYDVQDWKFVGTVVMPNGLVWHVFAEGK